MAGLLSELYPWIKSLHIMAVIAWMAGLFYLPRLFVYHTERSDPGTDMDDLFQVMERKLLKQIMNPAMITTWIMGLCLALTPGIVDWSAVWPWTKLVGIVGMTWFHIWLGQQRKAFATGQNALSGRSYRLMNEVPTVLMVVIVLSVMVKF